MENKYIYIASDGRQYDATPTYVFLATDGQYYPAPQEKVAMVGNQYMYVTENGNAPVLLQYVYTDDSGKLNAAPDGTVYAVTAAPTIPTPPAATYTPPVGAQQTASAAAYTPPVGAQQTASAAAYTPPVGAQQTASAATYTPPVGAQQTASAAAYTPPVGAQQTAPAAYTPPTAPTTYAAPDYSTLAVGTPGYIAPVPSGSVLIKELGTSRQRFRRSCNRVGGALWLYTLLSSIVAILVLVIYIFGGAAIASLSAAFSDVSDINGFMEEIGMILGTQGMMVAQIAAATVASIVPLTIISKSAGFKNFSMFKKGTRVKGLGWKSHIVGMGITIMWATIYSLLVSLIPSGSEAAATDMASMDTVSIVLYSIYTCLCAPFLEELIFRGVILKSLSRYGLVFAAVANSVLFGLLHGNIQQAPFAILVGIIFSYAAIRTGSIWTSIWLHFGINFFATAINVLGAYVFPDYLGYFNALYIGVGVVCFIIGIIILIRNRRKISWRPEDPEKCHTILPYEWSDDPEKAMVINRMGQPVPNTPVKAKGFHFTTSIGVLLFILFYLANIALGVWAMFM